MSEWDLRCDCCGLDLGFILEDGVDLVKVVKLDRTIRTYEDLAGVKNYLKEYKQVLVNRIHYFNKGSEYNELTEWLRDHWEHNITATRINKGELAEIEISKKYKKKKEG